MTSLIDFEEHNVCESKKKGLVDVDENVRVDGCTLTFVIGHCISHNQWKCRFVELFVVCVFVLGGLPFQLQRFC